MALLDATLLLLRQLPKDVAQVLSQFGVERLAPTLRNEYDVVLAFLYRVIQLSNVSIRMSPLVCLAAHERSIYSGHTPSYVKRLLPPRPSRGASRALARIIHE